MFTVVFLSILMINDNGFAQEHAERENKPNTITVNVTSKMSLVHVGSSDTFNATSEGIDAGLLLLESLENKNKKEATKAAAKAIKIYKKIVPRENYGGEYTALQWFAEYQLATNNKKLEYLKDPFVDDFFHFFGDKNFALLKEYLRRKYKLINIGDETTIDGQQRLAWLEDTILFNNPRREEWEKTSEFLKIMKLPTGAVIADVGCGPGYYTVKFAKMVGSKGTVFAIDYVKKHLDYIERLKEKLHLNNITTIHTDGESIQLYGEKIDAVFLCSLYHNIYGMTTMPKREKFIKSIQNVLKDGGRLYLFDNGLVEHGILPYHGPYVAKELVIGQLSYYGFKLVEQHTPVPQRYALVFKKIKQIDKNKKLK